MKRDQLEADLRELESLSKSRGWQIITDALSKDILSAAIDLGSDPRMPEAEMHFRRGSIFAATAFKTVVDQLLVKLENDILLAKPAAGFGPLNNPDATAQGDLG